MSSTYQVTYTAYERGGSNVLSEGTIPVIGNSSWEAEQTVKAMFNGLEVVIRYVMG